MGYFYDPLRLYHKSTPSFQSSDRRALCVLEMKTKLSPFGFIVFLGFALTFFILWLGIFLNDQNSISNKFASTGVLLIVAFFLLNLAMGAINGVPKTEIKISKKYALITFSISIGMFLISGIIEYT